jgi:hypothetical protein
MYASRIILSYVINSKMFILQREILLFHCWIDWIGCNLDLSGPYKLLLVSIEKLSSFVDCSSILGVNDCLLCELNLLMDIVSELNYIGG